MSCSGILVLFHVSLLHSRYLLVELEGSGSGIVSQVAKSMPYEDEVPDSDCVDEWASCGNPVTMTVADLACKGDSAKKYCRKFCGLCTGMTKCGNHTCSDGQKCCCESTLPNPYCMPEKWGCFCPIEPTERVSIEPVTTEESVPAITCQKQGAVCSGFLPDIYKTCCEGLTCQQVPNAGNLARCQPKDDLQKCCKDGGVEEWCMGFCMGGCNLSNMDSMDLPNNICNKFLPVYRRCCNKTSQVPQMRSADVPVATVERCCKKLGVPGDCLGLCRTDSGSEDYISGVLGTCDNHVETVAKCHRLGGAAGDRQKSTEDHFAAMDKDGDKKVSFDEFFAYVKLMNPPDPKLWDEFEEQFSADGRKMFNEADKNGDGYMELEELKAAGKP